MSAAGREDLQAVFGEHPWGLCPFDAVQSHLLPVRSVSRLPEQPKSIFVVLFPYLLEEDVYTDPRLSRYAVPKDYHLLCTEKLSAMCSQLQTMFSENRFVAFADASPVPEVYAAACAGLGVVGKNGLLLTEQYGSWVFIGEIVTDLALPCNAMPPQECCGCNACVSACPTGALSATGFCAERCLSHISQKRKLTQSDILLLRENTVLWGCDRCQLACPQNKKAHVSFDDSFRNSAKSTVTENDPQRAYAWRGDAILRNLALLEPEKE